MRIEDKGIIIGLTEFGERKAVLRCFTAEHGVMAGMISGYQNRNKRADYQLGNLVSLSWQARLREHLGSFHISVDKYTNINIYNDKYKLLSLVSICEILVTILPEHESYEELYYLTKAYILSISGEGSWWRSYIILELGLLSYIGYGLELDKCTVTNGYEDLYYISPRSGKAVSYEAGRAYHDKLFIIPPLLRHIDEGERECELNEIYETLRITKYFLEKAFSEMRKSMPYSRNLLAQSLEKTGVVSFC